MGTNSMWQQTEDMAKKQEESGGLWLKLANDGDRAVVVFLGGPYPRHVCFVDGKYVQFDEALKADGHRSTLRVAINVAMYDTKEVRILELGVVFFKDLLKVRSKYGLETRAFEIQRNGAANDPKTTYSLLPEHQLTEGQQRAFAVLPLHDLAKVYAVEPDDGEGVTFAAARARQGGPVDLVLAQGLGTQLKALPREVLTLFLQKFAIERIRDLPAAQFEQAKVFVEQQLEMAHASAPVTASAEVDPFA